GDNLTVTLTAANGTIFDADGNPLQLPLTGTAGEINAKLAALKFAATNVGDAKIMITVTDGKGGTATAIYKLLADISGSGITYIGTDGNGISIGGRVKADDSSSVIVDANGNLTWTGAEDGSDSPNVTLEAGKNLNASAVAANGTGTLTIDTTATTVGDIYGSTDASNIIKLGNAVGVVGGSNNDTITVQAGGTVTGTINGGAGNDTITVEKGGTVGYISGGASTDTITVESGTVTNAIFSEAGDDTISVFGTARLIYGGDDNDTITLKDGGKVDYIYGEAGNDIITVDKGGEVTWDINTDMGGEISGGEGADNISVFGTAHLIDGGDDNDTIIVESGGKVTEGIWGGVGEDNISVFGTVWKILGEAGNNIITVKDGGTVDYIFGGDDDDTITVENGGTVDYIGGNDGDDIIIVENGGEVTRDIEGGAGEDNISVFGTVTGEIWGGGGADTINLNNQQATIGISSGETGAYTNPGGSNTFDLSGIDRIDKPGSGTTLDLTGNWMGGGTTLTRNTTLVDVSNDTIQWIQGTVNADNTFTANDTGTDALIVYDADDKAGTVTARAVVLTGLTGSALKGVMTDGGLTITKNAAPVIDLASTETNNVIVGQPADLPNFTVSDADGDDLKITLKAVNGQISWNGFSWADTITMGFDQAKDINDALADLQFKAAQAGDASITITVDDKWGGTDSKTYNNLKATKPVVNTDPTISGIPKALQRISFETETALADFKVSDAENHNLTVTLAASGGDLSGVTDADDQEAGIQLKGSASAITNALANLKFKTTTHGDASISITVQDEYGATSAATYDLFTPYDTELALDNGDVARFIGAIDFSNHAFKDDNTWWMGSLYGVLSFIDSAIVDAEKSNSNSGDDLMCWAATTANLLTWSGWAQQSSLSIAEGDTAEDAVFAVFVQNFTSGATSGGNSMLGMEWFFKGTSVYDHVTGAFDRPGENSGNYLNLDGKKFISSKAEVELGTQDAFYTFLDNTFDLGYALGFSVTFYTDATFNTLKGGGHALTCWGYTYDNKGTVNNTSDDVLTGLIVSDSDDGMQPSGSAADDRLSIMDLIWDASGFYYTESFGTDLNGYAKIGDFYYVQHNSALYADTPEVDDIHIAGSTSSIDFFEDIAG
ncbi:calcium-binding protein, partial [Desulfosarcina sp. OttesenSCG-928-G17]|nr:calcium-binding protein [Desulfosarcina sp. OttesenSCG-928-G17]